MSGYFSMGGYALYIWPSYALGVLLLAAVFASAARRLGAAERAANAADGDAGRP